MSLLQMSFYGSVLILAIVMIRAVALHKLPKKVFVLLWGIALLRLLIPFSITSEFSLYSILPVHTLVQEFVPGTDTTTNKTATTLPMPLPTPDVSTDTDTATVITVTGLSDGDHLFVPLWIIFWSLGVLFVAAFFIISYVRCRREFATSLPAKEEAILSWQSNHPLKWAYEIRQSDKISAPLTYGILHPVILLPKYVDCSNTKQLHYVLLHELTHIRHLDALTKLLIVVTLCLHWFNPLVWVLYVLFNRDIEFYCDECVMSSEPEDSRSAYANTLIHMEEIRGFSMPLCNHFSKTAIEERIVSIMKTKKMTFGMILSGVFIVTLLSVTLLTGAKPVQGSLTSPPLPTVTPTPTPTLCPVPTSLPTVTPAPPTVSPQDSVQPKEQLLSGELYTLAHAIFEQFRQTMNNEVYHSSHYPETYQLTVWKHHEEHISIDYRFWDDNILSESGILSLYKVDGVWKIVAYLPDINSN